MSNQILVLGQDLSFALMRDNLHEGLNKLFICLSCLADMLLIESTTCQI